MNGGNVNRRDFLRLSGLTTAGLLAAACGAADDAPAADGGADNGGDSGGAATSSDDSAAAGSGLADVAREKTLILMFGGDGTQFTDVGLGNPYATGASHQMGSAALWEPLAFYSAFADETTPWLATDWSYNDDFTELTINIREGVSWSDGTPFTANDVAFTLNMLRDNAPTIRRSTIVQSAVQEANAVDDLTVQVLFNNPRPRFMFNQLMFKFDTGIYIVPQHVFEGVEDVASFEYYDPEQGWPLSTGPYTISEWTNTQKFIDRRDDWWAASTGFAELPEVERILVIPRADDTLMVQRIVNNEVDSILDLRANTIGQTVAQNAAITTHTGSDLPLGYMDWWPTSLWFNHEDGPFTTKEMRWAVSYSIDRQQMLDVGLQGSGIITPLPFPQYPPLEPYFEAAAPLLEKYPTTEFSLDKAAELMEGQGYAKDDEGFWAKDGERVPTVISGWQVFNDIGPIIAQQLVNAGFEAEFITPADNGTRISDGTQKIWLNGHGGTIADPFTTLDFYTSKWWAPIGEPTARNSRFRNEDYDAIVDEMASTPATDPGYTDLFLAAMEIWLEELVEAPIQQWLHRIPMNTTYWQGWPTEDDPYVNGAFWHLTFPMILHKLKAAG
ncbi:ABC transporter substrate-binding protein [Chloroflexi bacterium TSY]|nr:ABC transporter substrate-binding protein [Chloroflexi bacterium TSY]